MSPVPALRGPTLGSTLAAAGYATGIVGKTHFVARSIEDAHVAGMAPDDQVPEAFWDDFDGPYCGFEFVRHHSHHNASARPDAHYRRWLKEEGFDLDRIDALHGSKQRKLPSGLWEGMEPQWTQNAWITQESLRWVRKIQDEGRNWCLMANYQDPHYPMVCPDPYYSRVDMTGVDLGGAREGEFDDRPPFYRRFIEGKHWTDSDEVHFWDGICVPDTKSYDTYPAHEAIRAYIGMCEMVDDYIGRLLDGLEERGLLENTLVIFTSDHGDMLGRHGMWGKGVPAYDDQQRVPCLMQWSAVQKGPIGHSPSHFNHVDILPTALDAAGVEIPDFVQGVSHVPVLRGQVESVRDWALVDNYATVNLHQQTLVTGGWKLVCYRHADYGELYNLNQDPDQQRNLWQIDKEKRCAMLLKLAQVNMAKTGKMPLRLGPC
jgi:arylsulfatase A-like enzyme